MEQAREAPKKLNVFAQMPGRFRIAMRSTLRPGRRNSFRHEEAPDDVGACVKGCLSLLAVVGRSSANIGAVPGEALKKILLSPNDPLVP
jgi:hypothetical protein